MTKALVLFSGGLDSILALKLLQEQGIKVKALILKSYFFDSKEAEEKARELKIPFKAKDFSRKHLEAVKKPCFGYGKRANPCLDCRLLMLKEAKKEMGECSFVATGEVLGQRPMTQNRKALEFLAEASSLKEKLLRPLSAKLLEKTLPEKRGWLKREKLLALQGRSRKKQIELAEHYGLSSYPSPSGGCLLTDPEFSRKITELKKAFPDFRGKDVLLLKVGRHFWQGKAKIVLGRNQKENKKLKKLAGKKDLLLEMENYPGPSALIRNYGKGKMSARCLKKAKSLAKSYSSKARLKKKVSFKVWGKGALLS